MNLANKVAIVTGAGLTDIYQRSYRRKIYDSGQV